MSEQPRQRREPLTPQIWRYHSQRRRGVSRLLASDLQQPSNTRGSTGDYSIRDFLTVLFRHKQLIGTFFVAATVTVLLGLVLKRPMYETTAAILVKNNRAEVPLTTSRADAVMVPLSAEDLNSEVEILKSRQLVESSLRRLPRPSGNLGIMARARRFVKGMLGSPTLSEFDQTVVALDKRLSFRVIPRSNVVEIAYLSHDPQWGADVVGALLDEYLTYRMQVHRNTQVVSFFTAQTDSAARQLADAETALEHYTQETNLSMSHDEQVQLALRKLDEFERALGEAYVDVQREENQVSALETRIQDVPERLPTAYRLNQDPATEQLSSNLIQLRSERDGLLTRGYSPSNVRVRDIEAQIDLATARLKEAEDRIGEINRTELNSVYQNLRSELLTAQARLAGAQARHDALRTQVESFRREVSTLNDKSFDLTRLMREADAAERAYLLYREKRDEATAAQMLDQQSMVNVSIAREPRPPLTPIGLSRMVLLLSALVLVSICSIGIAFLREFLDHSFSTGEALERRLGIAHLASVPELKTVGAERALVPVSEV